MNLSSTDLRRIRQLSEQVRHLKEQNYNGITWEKAMIEVAKSSSLSSDEYYMTLALFQHFIDESCALTPLDMFLSQSIQVIYH